MENIDINKNRVYKKYTLQDLANELNTDVQQTWRIINSDIVRYELHIDFQQSVVDGNFYYYLSDDKLASLVSKTDEWYKKEN